MFRFFERLLEPTEPPPDIPPPVLDEPHALARFYWHFVRQARGWTLEELFRAEEPNRQRTHVRHQNKAMATWFQEVRRPA